jgi:hypothetical protein
LYHKFTKSPNGVFWLKERSGNNGAFSMVLGTILSATLMLFLSIKHGGLLAPSQSNRNFCVAFERVLNATNSPLPKDCPVAARITT